MTTVRVVQGNRVLAEIRVEALAEDTAVEVENGSRAGAPAPATPAPPRPRTWPGGLAWAAFGLAGILARRLLEVSFWSPWDHTRWTGLALLSFGGILILALGAGLLFVVLKVIGRRVLFVDAIRALSLLAWLLPALTAAALVGYYPLSPRGYFWFQVLVAVTTSSLAVAALASVRREPRSLAFTGAWAAVSCAAIVGLGIVVALGDAASGTPQIDLRLQPPIAGYAGTAESLDDYLAAIRSAAGRARGEDDRPSTTGPDSRAAALR
jgi:hypothetical protein